MFFVRGAGARVVTRLWGRACFVGLGWSCWVSARTVPLGFDGCVAPPSFRSAGFGASWGRACVVGLGWSRWVFARTVPVGFVGLCCSSLFPLCGFGASWGRACAFGLGWSSWVSARTVPVGWLSFRGFGLRGLARLWGRACACLPGRSPLGFGLLSFRGLGSQVLARLGDGPVLLDWGGRVGFLPGPSPLDFGFSAFRAVRPWDVVYAARVGRMRSRRTLVAYQAARLAAIARSSCGYWPPCGRTAAISRSKMWAYASFPFTRSNSVSSK